MRLLPLALALALSACDLNYDTTRESEPKPVPGDLRIRQTPANPVRAGTTVRLTAVYADSLKPGYRVVWFPAGAPQVEARTVEWTAPVAPGEYRQSVYVFAGSIDSATLLVYTVVVP